MFDLLNELDDEFQRIGELRITDDAWFEGVKRAAIVKAFEFCVEVHRDSEVTNSFFLAPALRGICEDLIAVTFFQGLPEKERSIAAVMRSMLASVEASEKQKRFFDKERPWQPVVVYPEAEKHRQNCEDALKLIGKRTGFWPKDKTSPNVYRMAQKAGLSEVYDFVYNITSDVVHFNPRILLRMGWGANGPRDVQFTTNNFSQYYKRMCQTYGVLLLLYQQRFFDLPFTSEAQAVFLRMQDKLDEDMRWVESVTHEELNLKPPSGVQRILLRVAHKRKTDNAT